jgi:hypothetical protein
MLCRFAQYPHEYFGWARKVAARKINGVSNVIASFSEWEQARVLIFLARCEMLAIHRR